jgi:hypothetical protein
MRLDEGGDPALHAASVAAPLIRADGHASGRLLRNASSRTRRVSPHERDHKKNCTRFHCPRPAPGYHG